MFCNSAKILHPADFGIRDQFVYFTMSLSIIMLLTISYLVSAKGIRHGRFGSDVRGEEDIAMGKT